MTIAVAVKVNSGIVLAADSAATLSAITPDGKSVVTNVHNNADKVINLCRDMPVGAAFWGDGSIGNASLCTVAKDFRAVCLGGKAVVKPNSYTIETIIGAFGEHVDTAIKNLGLPPGTGPSFGCFMAGYSMGGALPEVWRLQWRDGTFQKPKLEAGQDKVGISWDGQGDALLRLVKGFSIARLVKIVSGIGLSEDQTKALFAALESDEAPLTHPAMPLQDAIDLARFLVDTAINFVRFTPGAPTVGGPVDIAAITKHEGFRWIVRKHWYDNKYNARRMTANGTAEQADPEAP